VHLGYLLAEEAWGKGYGTEIVSGLAKAYERQSPILLVAGVDIGNPASARVLEKAGFQRSEARSTPDVDMYVRSP
jgi:ribosomal-protein-alanine N-acetyltransferase